MSLLLTIITGGFPSRAFLYLEEISHRPMDDVKSYDAMHGWTFNFKLTFFFFFVSSKSLFSFRLLETHLFQMLSKILFPSSTFRLCLFNVPFTFSKGSLFYFPFYFEFRATQLSASRLSCVSHFCYSAEAKFHLLNYINRIYVGSN